MLKGITPEEFINQNPFPENGAEINTELVKSIQETSDSSLREELTQKLFKVNARLIFMVYKQYNYNQSLSSIMSFVYEGIQKASLDFNPNIGMPFYNFAVQKIRATLQNDYNYNGKLVHIPVMKKKDVEHEYSDINDYLEHESMKYMETSENPLLEDLKMILIEYESQELTDIAKEELKILKLYLNRNTLKDISEQTDISTNKVKKMRDSSIERIKKFKVRWTREMGF
jgi:DNA-directed RNA polymerase sigma subunit (sigma70/sigma32)